MEFAQNYSHVVCNCFVSLCSHLVFFRDDLQLKHNSPVLLLVKNYSCVICSCFASLCDRSADEPEFSGAAVGSRLNLNFSI